MGIGYGYGKVILFNEHFVVYGIPAIASAIDKKTVAEVKKSSGESYTLYDERDATPGYKEEKWNHQQESIVRIMKAMDITEPLKIWLRGDLKAASGVGASAASCTAIARALSEEFNLNLDDDAINDLSYEGEKAYHGNPSGIDNTCATYGGLVWFIKDHYIEHLTLPEPVEVVMGNTGVVANTKKAVAGVRERVGCFREKYDAIFTEARDLVNKARKILHSGDWEQTGYLMNMNHELLQQIEVSSKELDFLVDVSLRHGALGAKMTGGGLGGYMVALTPSKKLQETVASAIEREGFFALRTRIGV